MLQSTGSQRVGRDLVTEQYHHGRMKTMGVWVCVWWGAGGVGGDKEKRQRHRGTQCTDLHFSV